jgi:hypothetical protein
MGNCARDEVHRVASSSLPRAAQGAEPRRSNSRQAAADRPLLRHQGRQGLVAQRHSSESRRRRRRQERSLGGTDLHAPERPARQDQCREVLQHDARRTAGQSHLVHVHDGGNAAGGLALRRRLRARRDALRQHGERRTSVRLRQGRQDRPHDADRVRRQRSAAVDDQGEREGVHAAA